MRAKFREEAMDNASLGQKIDSDIRLVSIRMWVLLVTSLLLVGGLLIWGIFGSVPITMEVPGIYTYSLGKIMLRADKSGTVEAALVHGSYVYKGTHICALKGGARIESAAECLISDVFVKAGDWVDKGDVLYEAMLIPADGVYVERAYLFVPYDQKYLFRKNQPVQLDLVGISEDTSLMKGFISGSNERNDTVTREDIGKRYGQELIEELITDEKPYVMMRCSPLELGNPENTNYDESMSDMTSMGWASAMIEKAYGNPDESDLDDFALPPDMSLVRATVTLEYRRPITLLIPALESIFKPIPAEYDEDEINYDRSFEPKMDDITWLLLETLE